MLAILHQKLRYQIHYLIHSTKKNTVMGKNKSVLVLRLYLWLNS